MFSYEALYQQQVDMVSRLPHEVEGLFHIADVRASLRGDAVLFVGKLLNEAEPVYNTLQERFHRLGYTALLRREGDSDIVVAQKGVSPIARLNPAVNVILLGLTLITTLLAGAG